MTLKAWLVVALIGLLGATAALWEMRYRMGMNTDATAYLGISRHVAAGDGPLWPYGAPVLKPTVHFPPLFPEVIGTLGRLTGRDPLDLGPYFQAALLGLSLTMTGWAVLRCTRSLGAAAVATGFLLLTVDVLDAHVNFMSEPLFVFLVMAGLLVLDVGAQRRQAWAALPLVFLGGCCLGLSYWCRYAGIAFVGAAGVALLLYPRRSWRERVVLAAVAAVPMAVAVWALGKRNELVGGHAAARDIRFQADQLKYLGALILYPAIWIVPVWAVWGKWWVGIGPLWGLSLCGLVLFCRGLFQARCDRRSQRAAVGPDSGPLSPPDAPRVTPGVGTEPGKLRPGAPGVFAWAAGAYVGMLAFSMICVDPPATPLETRLLVPALLPIVVVAAWALRRAMQTAPTPRPIVVGLALMLAGIAMTNVVRLKNWYHGGDERYLLFTEDRWIKSPTARYVKDYLPKDAMIYCNSCDALYFLTGHDQYAGLGGPGARGDRLYFLTGRNGYWLPKCHDGHGQPNPKFAAQVRQMRDELARNHGYVVCFNDAWYSHFGGADEKTLTDVADFVVVVKTEDGTIYRAPAPGEETATRPGREDRVPMVTK